VYELISRQTENLVGPFLVIHARSLAEARAAYHSTIQELAPESPETDPAALAAGVWVLIGMIAAAVPARRAMSASRLESCDLAFPSKSPSQSAFVVTDPAKLLRVRLTIRLWCTNIAGPTERFAYSAEARLTPVS
jgi:hypothetical protein